MKLFIDTANVEEIRKANDMGVICGVTTNPSLIAKEGRDFVEVVKEITAMIFSAAQALLAARAGASYVSPFMGRLDDIGEVGADLVADIAEIFDIHGIDTEIIAASTRNPLHVTDAAKAGAHISTVPYKVLMQMTKHHLTDAGIARFLADWESVAAQ